MVVAVTGVLGATACGGTTPISPGVSGSRATLYSNLSLLVADSSTVVAGEAVSSVPRNDDDGLPTTYVTIRVGEVFDPATLGDNLPPELLEAAAKADVREGAEVFVKQYGSADSPGEFPPLELNDRYLLFLVPTLQDGDDPATFYVVGASAGIYAADGTAFTRAYPQSGDTLPAELTTADLRRAG